MYRPVPRPLMLVFPTRAVPLKDDSADTLVAGRQCRCLATAPASPEETESDPTSDKKHTKKPQLLRITAATFRLISSVLTLLARDFLSPATSGWLNLVRRRGGRAISEDPMPRYKCKSIAALDIALGGLPAKMRVEADVGTGVSAKTVGELRKVTTWSENMVITTPEERSPESAVKISKATVATRTSPKP